TPRPKNGQIISTLYDLLRCYQANIKPDNLCHAVSHLTELITAMHAGIGAISSLIFWAVDNEEYKDDSFKQDISNIAYLLIQLEQVIHFAENERANINFLWQK